MKIETSSSSVLNNVVVTTVSALEAVDTTAKKVNENMVSTKSDTGTTSLPSLSTIAIFGTGVVCGAIGMKAYSYLTQDSSTVSPNQHDLRIAVNDNNNAQRAFQVSEREVREARDLSDGVKALAEEIESLRSASDEFEERIYHRIRQVVNRILVLRLALRSCERHLKLGDPLPSDIEKMFEENDEKIAEIQEDPDKIVRRIVQTPTSKIRDKS